MDLGIKCGGMGGVGGIGGWLGSSGVGAGFDGIGEANRSMGIGLEGSGDWWSLAGRGLAGSRGLAGLWSKIGGIGV